MLASGRLVAGSRAGMVLRPTGVPAWPAKRSSRCRNLLARERTQIGDTARQLSQKPVELADKLHLQGGFNRPALLNVLVPLNPRHFSDAVNEVKMHIAKHAHVHAHDTNRTCTCRTLPRRARAAPTAPAGTASSAEATRSATAQQLGPKFPGSQPPVRPAAAPEASPLAHRPRWKALDAWGAEERLRRRSGAGPTSPNPPPLAIQARASGATRRRGG